MHEQAFEPHVSHVNVESPADLVPVFAKSLFEATRVADVNQRSVMIQLVDSLPLREQVDFVVGQRADVKLRECRDQLARQCRYDVDFEMSVKRQSLKITNNTEAGYKATAELRRSLMPFAMVSPSRTGTALP